MNKIITDIPDKAEKIVIHAFDHEDFDLGQKTFDVRTMQNAPDKRVIELPFDLLHELKGLKYEAGSVIVFLNFIQKIVNKDLRERIFDAVNTNTLADFYLGNVEFVAEKEPMFIVIGTIDEDETVFYTGRDGGLYSQGTFIFRDDETNEIVDTEDFPLPKMNEEEADKLIMGLGGEDGYLKPRKVKVED